MTSTVTEGSVSYSDFLVELKKANDPKYRVVANFLRPALFGFQSPTFIPKNILLGLLGGHFSPVLGVFEQNVPNTEDNAPLVAIFDLNSDYGLFFCSSKRLYLAVRAADITTAKSRALITVSTE